MRQFKKGKTDEINFAMADASVLGEIPNPKRESGDKGKKSQKKCFIANKEAYERVNYLYQVAHLALAQDPENLELSRYYISTAKKITDKLVLKIDPEMKRTICKCCHNLLIPGITARHRMRGKREKHLAVTCMTCGTIKRRRTNNNYIKGAPNAFDQKGERPDEAEDLLDRKHRDLQALHFKESVS